jgi:hypothetical protein
MLAPDLIGAAIIPISTVGVKMIAGIIAIACPAIIIIGVTVARVYTLIVMSITLIAKVSLRVFVVSTRCEDASQFRIRQFKLSNRIFRQLRTLFITETLTIEFVFPSTDDVTIHEYFLSLHITLLHARILIAVYVVISTTIRL